VTYFYQTDTVADEQSPHDFREKIHHFRLSASVPYILYGRHGVDPYLYGTVLQQGEGNFYRDDQPEHLTMHMGQACFLPRERDMAFQGSSCYARFDPESYTHRAGILCQHEVNDAFLLPDWDAASIPFR